MYSECFRLNRRRLGTESYSELQWGTVELYPCANRFWRRDGRQRIPEWPPIRYTLWNRETLGAILTTSVRMHVGKRQLFSKKHACPSTTLAIATPENTLFSRNKFHALRMGIFRNNALSTLAHRQSKLGTESRMQTNCLLISLLPGNSHAEGTVALARSQALRV